MCAQHGLDRSGPDCPRTDDGFRAKQTECGCLVPVSPRAGINISLLLAALGVSRRALGLHPYVTMAAISLMLSNKKDLNVLMLMVPETNGVLGLSSLVFSVSL